MAMVKKVHKETISFKMEEGKSRVIIIKHPKFNEGIEGVADAKEFGETLANMIEDFKIQISESNDLSYEVKKVELNDLSKVEILVRKIPDELL